MTVNAMEATAGEVRAAHREQCFDAIRATLGLGDTKGDTGAWLDWIDAVAAGRSSDEVVKLTMEQKRKEGTLGSKVPPANWFKAQVETRRSSGNAFTPGPWRVDPTDRCEVLTSDNRFPKLLQGLDCAADLEALIR